MHHYSLGPSSADSATLPALALKGALVGAAHLALLLTALHASGVVTLKAAPRPAGMLTVMLVAAPARPTPAAPAHKPVPVVAQAAPARPAAVAPPRDATLAIAETAIPAAAPAAAIAAAVATVAGTPAAAPEQRSEASFNAAYLNNPEPVYPLASRRQGEAGKVVLLVQVSPQGTVERLEVRQSCGFARLDQAALDAVRRWRFVPARLGEHAIAASVLVPLTFSLNS
ncbi:energy transducer TonB [Duganella violaceipulchra]|uniref:Energy transducer TonB n=1 Tax=Duganella violaceipulchra TaxID=2849652 RepID=A0AA41H9H3_9BURK|nr:energy transducer TonB [Duganella violaceicalia]MBV6324517.1 energy transducer TonB [Duganella violaceicalia]MCP2009223.1 protein TonB [Duganella violaceicalia]